MASWGDTSTKLNAAGDKSLPWPVGPDGREGNQPHGTRVLRNIVREVGLWQKQSSPWFQAVTAKTLLSGNVFFNGPRAGLNFNDGFGPPPPQLRASLFCVFRTKPRVHFTRLFCSGGGDEIAENLVINMVRESKDQ